MKKRGRCNNEFEPEVLRMAKTSDKPLAELERNLGVSPGLIRKWQQCFTGCARIATSSGSEKGESQAEILRLKREVEIARQECNKLKKAI